MGWSETLRPQGHLDYVLPYDISQGAVGGPEYLTTVVSSGSGFSTAKPEWSSAGARWTIRKDQLTEAQWENLLAFFMMAMGRAFSFWMKDPIDGVTLIPVRFDDDWLQGSIESFDSYNCSLSVVAVELYTPGVAPDVIGDTTPPSVPLDVIATVVSSSQINLSWTASTGGAADYLIERALVGGSFSQIAISTTPGYVNTGLAPGTSYNYRVRSRDAAGNISAYSVTITAATLGSPVPGDTQRPTIPGSLTAVAASDTQINLSWLASTDDTGVTDYLIERRVTTTGSFVQIAVIVDNSATPTYSDTGLTAGTVYGYRVRARDAAGNVSAYSAIASATTTGAGRDTTPPSTPTSLAATVISSTQINLSWTPSTDNVAVTGYQIERSVSGGLFAQIATTTGASYNNTGLTPSTAYTYRVRAIDAAGNQSAYSATASETTSAPTVDTTPPSAPTGLTATAVGNAQINLSWSASTDDVGVTGYRIERRIGTAAWTQIAVVTGLSYSNTGLASSTTYEYRVRAADAAGNLSTYSATQSATTGAAGGRVYSTNFDIAENPISEGSNWKNGAVDGIDWKNVKTVAGIAKGTQIDTGYDDSTAILTGSWNADQQGEATVWLGTRAGFQEVEIRLRTSLTAHDCHGYEVLFSVGVNPYIQIVRWNGPLNDWTLLDGRTATVSSGDTIKATVVGNVIKAYLNGVLILSVTDSTYSTGAPGVGFYINGGDSDNFGLASFTAKDL